MRYLLKFLQRAGLVSTLLIGGVLGGLIAPLSSEATTLTLQADTGDAVSILDSPVACADTANFNKCFSLAIGAQALGNNGRYFSINNAPNQTARLNINDVAGSQNRAKLTGVRFYPTSTAWGCSSPTAGSKNCAIRDENHSLKVVMTNQFLNSASLGSFSLGLRSGGNTTAGPSTTANCGNASTGLPALCNSQYNLIKYYGTGDFNTSRIDAVTNLLGVSPANPSPLQIQMPNTDPTLSWTTQLDQTATYPTFDCNTGTDSSGKVLCQPIVTSTYILSLYGPDTATLNDSNDIVGGGCNITNNKGGQDPQGPPCFSSSKNTKSTQDSITATFTAENIIDKTADDAVGAVAGRQCTDADHCPCADPDTCRGTIVIEMVETPAKVGLAFPFYGSGPGIPGTFNVPEVGGTNSSGVATRTFPNLPTVGSGPWSFTADIANFPPILNFNGFWKVDSISCVSKLNIPATYDTLGVLLTPEILFSTWTTDSGSDKRNATVTLLGGGDTVTCSYHAHKNSGN